MTDFDQNIIDSCPILSNSELSNLIEQGKMEPIYLHCYRLARYVTDNARRKVPSSLIDDDDWRDAVQECMLLVPEIVRDYEPSKKFNSYAGRIFERTALAYMRRLTGGGIASDRTQRRPDKRVHLMELFTDADSEDSRELSYIDPPMGFRSPEDETLAGEDVHEAMTALHDMKGRLGNKRGMSKREKRERQDFGYRVYTELG